MKTFPQPRLPVSLEELQSIWSGFNASYFQNRLLPIDIQWSRRLTASAGLFVSQTGPRDRDVPPEERHGTGRVIRLSVPLLRDQSLDEIRGTLGHEMIHQWQFDVKKCRPSHGREFRRVMQMMNRDGLGITIYHSLTREVEALAKYTWRCVQCGRSYYRQRNTLSSKRHRCGYCMGSLMEVSPLHKWGQLHGDGKPKTRTSSSEVRSQPIQLTFDFLSSSEGA